MYNICIRKGFRTTFCIESFEKSYLLQNWLLCILLEIFFLFSFAALTNELRKAFIDFLIFHNHDYFYEIQIQTNFKNENKGLSLTISWSCGWGKMINHLQCHDFYFLQVQFQEVIRSSTFVHYTAYLYVIYMLYNTLNQ